MLLHKHNLKKMSIVIAHLLQEAAVKAKKSGRLLCKEPIQIFWHSSKTQTPRPDSHTPIPVPSSDSRPRDPRLVQSRFHTGPLPGNQQGKSEIERKQESSRLLLQGGRKRPADVAGLGTEEGGRGGGVMSVKVTEGGRGSVWGSVWGRLGGIEGEETRPRAKISKVTFISCK